MNNNNDEYWVNQPSGPIDLFPTNTPILFPFEAHSKSHITHLMPRENNRQDTCYYPSGPILL